MPTVEKFTGGRVNVRDIGEFERGDQAEVSTADAAYLCDERGDFERVDVGDEDDDTTDDQQDSAEEICGAELSGGGTCDRPADDCPYHGDEG